MAHRIVLQSIIAAGAIVFFSFYRLSGCFNKTPGGNQPTVPMQIGSKQFNLEIANTEAKRNTGLMRRDSMPADHGMIFVFAKEARHSFWMRNTRIPLDIIFINSDGIIASIQQMKPYSLDSVEPPVPVKYAIELNEGAAAKAGVKVGDRLVIPKEAQDVKR